MRMRACPPTQVFAGPLAGGGRAVVLLNRHTVLSQYPTTNISVRARVR